MNKLEAVARAISQSADDTTRHWKEWLDTAQAAIEAMEELIWVDLIFDDPTTHPEKENTFCLVQDYDGEHFTAIWRDGHFWIIEMSEYWGDKIDLYVALPQPPKER